MTFTGVTDKAKVAAIELVPVAGPVGGTPLATYSYRGDGLRASKTAGGATTTYTWDVGAGLPVVLQDGAYTYVYGRGGSLISQTTAARVQTYLLADGLGSTAALTDGSGAVTGTLEYDAFGQVWFGTGTAASEYRFAGQQDDATLGFQYLRARYYDPVTGRFVSRDAFPGTASMPASQHPYSYALNSPTNFTDPSGRVVPAALALAAIASTPEGAAALTFAAGAVTLYLQAHRQEIVDFANQCYAGAASIAAATQTDRYKQHLTDDDLEGARDQRAGKVIRWSDGTVIDHEKEVRDAQTGLLDRIKRIKNRLGYPGTSDAEREGLVTELGEASRLLDRSERYLPR